MAEEWTEEQILPLEGPSGHVPVRYMGGPHRGSFRSPGGSEPGGPGASGRSEGPGCRAAHRTAPGPSGRPSRPVARAAAGRPGRSLPLSPLDRPGPFQRGRRTARRRTGRNRMQGSCCIRAETSSGASRPPCRACPAPAARHRVSRSEDHSPRTVARHCAAACPVAAVAACSLEVARWVPNRHRDIPGCRSGKNQSRTIPGFDTPVSLARATAFASSGSAPCRREQRRYPSPAGRETSSMTVVSM
jgi:hypothetical protein